MSAALAKWTCSQCGAALPKRQPQHEACHAPSKWLCVWSEASCLYKNYKRHTQRCGYCSPERLRQITAAERADKENRLSTAVESESSQSAVTPASNSAVDS